MEVAEYRETEKAERIMADMMVSADWVWHVDCADRRASFVVLGWFVVPGGASIKSPEVHLAS